MGAISPLALKSLRGNPMTNFLATFVFTEAQNASIEKESRIK
jgi:hypothetical protein